MAKYQCRLLQFVYCKRNFSDFLTKCSLDNVNSNELATVTYNIVVYSPKQLHHETSNNKVQGLYRYHASLKLLAMHVYQLSWGFNERLLRHFIKRQVEKKGPM